MTFQNYEYAQEILDRSDPTARAIAACIHRWMISDELRLDPALRPSAAFDMSYFYDSLARTFSTALSRPIDSGLAVRRSIQPVDIPRFEDPAWRQYPFVVRGLAAKFIDCIRADATDQGETFDARFACLVACRALDDTAIAAITTAHGGPLGGRDFDEWVSGFSSLADEPSGIADGADRDTSYVSHADSPHENASGK